MRVVRLRPLKHTGTQACFSVDWARKLNEINSTAELPFADCVCLLAALADTSQTSVPAGNSIFTGPFKTTISGV